MEIQPIKTETDYLSALKEIERLFGADPDTPEGDLLDILVTLVEAFEERHYRIPLPDPIEAIKYHMESRGLLRKDLEPYIGSRSRVSEILNRKRALSLSMIRQLEAGLGIPAEILIQPYDLATERVESTDKVVIPYPARSARTGQAKTPLRRKAAPEPMRGRARSRPEGKPLSGRSGDKTNIGGTMTLLDDVVTIVEAEELYGLSRGTLKYHIRGGALTNAARQSGATWLIDRVALERAIVEGTIGTKSAQLRAQEPGQGA